MAYRDRSAFSITVISLVVVCYGEHDAAIRNCSEFLGDDRFNLVFVLNDGNSDAMTEVDRFCNVTKVVSKINAGYGVGNNIGVRAVLDYSDDALVLVKNPDVVISPDNVLALAEFLNSLPPQRLTVSPATINPDTRRQYNFISKRGLLTRTEWIRSAIVESDIPNGCCMMFRPSEFATDLFSDYLFLYFEEIDVQLKFPDLRNVFLSKAHCYRPSNNEHRMLSAISHSVVSATILARRHETVTVGQLAAYIMYVAIWTHYLSLRSFNLDAVRFFWRGLRDAYISK